MKLRKIDVAILWPVGPFCSDEHIVDNLESIASYVPSERCTIIVDNSGECRVSKIAEQFTDVVVLEVPKPLGKGHGLYKTICHGIQYLVSNYDARVVLRLDTDALVVGSGTEKEAMEYFDKYPRCAIIGSHKVATTGKTRDFSLAADNVSWFIAPARWITSGKWVLKLLRRPVRLIHSIRVGGWVRAAEGCGYERGEHCMGGACFINPTFLLDLVNHNLLFREELKHMYWEEDMMFGLLAYKLGYRLGDFATNGYPMGLKHIGLPMSPKKLIENGKKVVHSTRGYRDWDEKCIRRFFRARREQ